MGEVVKSKRNVSLDLLRIIAMLMIVALHYLGKGGSLYTSNYYIKVVSWFLEFASIIAVNLYVLISGYFLIDSKFKWSKVFKLMLEVWFYCITILLLSLIFNVNLSIREIFYSIAPISLSCYWFITIYLLMYILSPYLNKLISIIDKKQHFSLIIILVFLFSVLNFIVPVFDGTNGYGINWFIILYLISSYIKKYLPNKKSNKYLFCYLFTTILLVVMYLGLEVFIDKIDFIKNLSVRLCGYNNILVLISSLSLFMYFRSIDVKNIKLINMIKFLSSSTLGVYLIHENFIVRNRLYNGIFNSLKYANDSVFIFILMFIVSVISIFLGCIVIDKFRIKLFNYLKDTKLIKKIDKLISKLLKKFNKIFDYLVRI